MQLVISDLIQYNPLKIKTSVIINRDHALFPVKIDYSKMDQSIISLFKGTHPKIIQGWAQSANEIFKADPDYKLTNKQKKHRVMIIFEKLFGLDLSKKHFKLLK